MATRIENLKALSIARLYNPTVESVNADEILRLESGRTKAIADGEYAYKHGDNESRRNAEKDLNYYDLQLQREADKWHNL